MFTENDFMTPRERVNETLRQRMLNSLNNSCLDGRESSRSNESCSGCRKAPRSNESCSERREAPRSNESCSECCEAPRSNEHNFQTDNGCNGRSWGLEEYPLASVFAPLQNWRNIYDAETALSRGTIFKELDLPFLCGERKGGNCRGR